MFSYSQDFEGQDNAFELCSHLRDAATSLGLDVPASYGLSDDLESEQLATIQEALETAIAEEIALQQERDRQAKTPPCYIGPYAGGICTICGLRQP